MKKIDERVILYEDKQGDTELDIHMTFQDMLDAVRKTNWYKEADMITKSQFVPRCDFCGMVDTDYHYFPELGHKVECNKCAKDHKKHVKWYIEDTHTVFNGLILWVLTYDIGWSERELDRIDEFFASKGHYDVHIRKFIENNKR